MTSASVGRESWVDRAVDRSAAVQRSRTRIAKQVGVMLDAARRLIREKDDFTTQDLVLLNQRNPE
jgi:TetR/AcrR family transcriptional regulator